MDNSPDCQMNKSKSVDILDEKQNHSSDTEVPEKYKDILTKKLVVNLIRYENIEETFNSSTLKPNT